MKYKDFIHMSVAGDGSCFFHSLSQILILEGNSLPRTTLSKKLRKQCVDWLEDNLEYRIKGIGLTIKDEIEEEIRINVSFHLFLFVYAKSNSKKLLLLLLAVNNSQSMQASSRLYSY